MMSDQILMWSDTSSYLKQKDCVVIQRMRTDDANWRLSPLNEYIAQLNLVLKYAMQTYLALDFSLSQDG